MREDASANPALPTDALTDPIRAVVAVGLIYLPKSPARMLEARRVKMRQERKSHRLDFSKSPGLYCVVVRRFLSNDCAAGQVVSSVPLSNPNLCALKPRAARRGKALSRPIRWCDYATAHISG